MSWKLERLETFPFGYRVTDAAGNVMLHEDMCAHSSKDDSHEDALTAPNFRGDGQLEARIANEAQLAKLEMIVAAVNRYIASTELRDALIDAGLQITYLHEKLGSDTGTGNASLARIRAAIAKAEGRT